MHKCVLHVCMCSLCVDMSSLCVDMCLDRLLIFVTRMYVHKENRYMCVHIDLCHTYVHTENTYICVHMYLCSMRCLVCICFFVG